MELLEIKHDDFVMYIECSKYIETWGKAVRNIGEEELYSQYSWTDGVESVVLQDFDKNDSEPNEEDNESIKASHFLKKGLQDRAIFFDNTDYPIWVEFNKNVNKASFGSLLQSENDKFTFRHKVLAGFINYGNEVGRSEINIIYSIDGHEKRFTFSFEVLSTKLNYHENWKDIIEDIEREYRMLSLDYMKRTFHGFSPDQSGETPELVWWSVFSSEQKNFISACKNIIERPHHRLHARAEYKRADKLTIIPCSVENELAEHRMEAGHLYRVEERVQTNDTPENRFLKFALNEITEKYDNLKKRIEDIKNVSEVVIKDMETTSRTLIHLKRNPFFRSIGRYKGMNQESLVLQKATGYSQVYRIWNLLRRGYSLYDGMYRLQTKDIATLYEIWCFIEVSHIVKEQLGLNDEDVEQRNRMEMNGVFTWSLGKGEQSRILFKKDNVELAELVYNPKSSEKENSNIGMKNLVVPTVPQKPDIVLQLTKNDLKNDMKFTYLFDAKYRIEGKVNGVDVPPDDTINQMHRYRDAIYYKDYDSKDLKKEVIGGYILFPGDGESADIQTSRFYKSISEVNIGAFPLRPKDEHNRQLLKDFISMLIDKKSHDIISEVIPQKGTFVEVGNRVIIGIVKSRDNKTTELLEKQFESKEAKQYYTGKNLYNKDAGKQIMLNDVHYFIPYIKEKGIRDVYEITGIHPMNKNEAKKAGDGNNVPDIRIAFDIKYSRPLFEDYHKLNSDYSLKIRDLLIDTTFNDIDKITL